MPLFRKYEMPLRLSSSTDLHSVNVEIPNVGDWYKGNGFWVGCYFCITKLEMDSVTNSMIVSCDHIAKNISFPDAFYLKRFLAFEKAKDEEVKDLKLKMLARKFE